ncbi:hypothetical protein [Streptomyces stackebrandtii]|uniref:hypothetical protein n=1 Tax=Streptomyces stackebrandtii TaxID=3051177 RepID=UPI0028DC07FE|nr:hypothetical protein [Streptomyces sp. DSM 40976]
MQGPQPAARPNSTASPTNAPPPRRPQRAFTLAFTDPAVADDELELAEQLLTGLDLPTTTLTTRSPLSFATPEPTATPSAARRSSVAEIRTAALLAPEAMLDLALAFHHAVHDDRTEFEALVERPEQLTGARAAKPTAALGAFTSRPFAHSLATSVGHPAVTAMTDLCPVGCGDAVQQRGQVSQPTSRCPGGEAGGGEVRDAPGFPRGPLTCAGP